MKVLYFDGSSAAKLPEGTMDTQDLVAWSEMKPEWIRNEQQRITDLCEWGQKYGVNGFVRFVQFWHALPRMLTCDDRMEMNLCALIRILDRFF
jgi:hypothetical protein